MKLEFIQRQTLKDKPTDESKLGFGRIFTDYMLLMKRNAEKGWHYAAIEPYGELSLSPAALVLHYAQEVFEGLKAYRSPDGRTLLFRPWDNIKRLVLSAERMSMRPFDAEFLLEALYELIRIERDWIPKAQGTSLYIRPAYIGIDPYVGIASAEDYYLYIILSPVGAYYAKGLAPVDIYVQTEYVRSVKGGTGSHKTGANYAISLKASELAHKNGFSQVLWLDGRENRYIEEVGSMNIFFKIDGELITPPLGGTILAGITRDSIIAIAKDMGVKVSERQISIDELYDAYKRGSLEEAFGSGTACVVSPVGKFVWGDKEIIPGGSGMGELTKRFYDTLTGIQLGIIEDKFGWVKQID
ncbi:MAG: branched-chain amino acid aminotransferase [Deferribacteraceae bacterium]|jgi:branched-chain amino acid aminotransferase|nr:branched-chain amino acid aminotransferase [Deferribacteraceae bacterium]